MAEPIARKRKDGTTAWYARVKMATGEWDTVRLRAARDRPSARKLNHQLQEAEDRKSKGLAPGGALFIGTFAELCDHAWKRHCKGLAGAKEEASRLHIHGGARADRDELGPSPLGPLLATLITPTRLEEYFADLAETPTVRGRPMSPRAINRIRSTFSTVFAVAQRFGKWPKGEDNNPAIATLQRDAAKHEIRTLTVSQILPVLEAAGEYWDGPFAVCLLAGLRRGEMLALQKQDVDLDRGVIIVRRSGDRDTTKGNTHDPLPIHDELVPYLERWMKSPGPWMFPNREGGQRTENQRFDLRLQAALVRAGYVDHYEFRCRCSVCPLRRLADDAGRPVKRGGHIERHDDDAPRRCEGCGTKLICTPKAIKINFHATRHSFATAALESGASLQGVQKLMRHSDPRLTTEIYGHVSTGFLADEVDRINLRAEARPGEPRRRGANAANGGRWTTPPRIEPTPEPRGLVTPVRRGPWGVVGGGDSDAEPSMKMASGIVEPTGIEPVTYALRKQGRATVDAPHASQALANPSEFSRRASISASHGSAAKASVNSTSVTPVRRGSRPASQAREGSSSMREHPSAAPADGQQDTAAPVLLTVGDVARRLQVSEKWVRYRIELGELEPIRLGGSRMRISAAALEAFVQRSQR